MILASSTSAHKRRAMLHVQVSRPTPRNVKNSASAFHGGKTQMEYAISFVQKEKFTISAVQPLIKAAI